MLHLPPAFVRPLWVAGCKADAFNWYCHDPAVCRVMEVATALGLYSRRRSSLHKLFSAFLYAK